MKELMMKARSGVTLVELLVVILIVTILSVSLLPLLKPFVVEAQYAAEAIPVIGNLRTKIGLYQYDKGVLPSVRASATAGLQNTELIETWAFSTDGTTVSANETDSFIPGYRTLANSGVAAATVAYQAPNQTQACFGFLTNIDNQDLVGRRCKPVHYQYTVQLNTSAYCYVLGCFGDDHGLPNGTGYAVCEINVTADDNRVYKMIGTWKRYKATTNAQLTFAPVNAALAAGADRNATTYCAIPANELLTAPTATAGVLDMIAVLESYGWEF